MLTPCPSVTNALHQRRPLIERLNTVADTLMATPLTWNVSALAFNVILPGRRLSTSSPLGYSAWAWIFESKLSSNIPLNSLGHGGNFILSERQLIRHWGHHLSNWKGAMMSEGQLD